MFNMLIHRYPVYMSLGVYSQEHLQRSLVLVDVDIEYSANPSQDQLSETVDYSKLIEVIDEQLQGKRISLVETSVNLIGRQLLEQFPVIQHAKVYVEKTSFPNNLVKSGSIKISKSFSRNEKPS